MNTSFDKGKHEYLIDGKRATGITTIIGVLDKPALIGWAAKMAVEYVKENAPEQPLTPLGNKSWLVGEQILEEAKSAHRKKKEEAGAHGTDAHALVEEYINLCLKQTVGVPMSGGQISTQPHFDAITQFILWANENVDHFLFSERQMFNKELFIAGTADFAYIGKDGKKYMADFKTSSGIYGIDYYLQVAGYRFLAESEGDAPYDGSCIVRLGKDGSFETMQRYDYETDKTAFLACVTLYRATKSFVKPKT